MGGNAGRLISLLINRSQEALFDELDRLLDERYNEETQRKLDHTREMDGCEKK